MKKFLSSLLLALCFGVVLTPAHADDACKNLFDYSRVDTTTFVIGDNIISNKEVDNRATKFQFWIMGLKDGNVQERLSASTIDSTGQKQIVFTVPERVHSVFFKHNGVAVDLYITNASKAIEIPAGTYTISFDAISVDPTTVGGLQLKDVQLEKGSTATTHVPYNPLCATCQGIVKTYESAVGTVAQNGTPTPTNPIEPTFYTQGDMVLRAIGQDDKLYTDTYDATTGKITRRVGVKVLYGTETWRPTGQSFYTNEPKLNGLSVSKRAGVCSHFQFRDEDTAGYYPQFNYGGVPANGNIIFAAAGRLGTGVDGFKQWLTEQYNAGTPVTVYYPLATPVEETWTGGTSYCAPAIKIATTAYNNNAFSSVQTALNNAVTAIKDVVSNTIAQAAAVQSLQTAKQTMPDASDTDGTCPRFRQCLLIQDPTGKPHWFPILDPFRDFVTPIIENGVTASTGTSNAGYTQLEYIESTGTQRINTGVAVNNANSFEIEALPTGPTEGFLISQGNNSLRVSTGRASWFSRNYHFTITYSNPTFMNFQCGLNYLKVDGTDVTGGADTDNASGTTVYLFAINTNVAHSFSKAQVRKFKIWDGNGALVRDFVPVRQNSTGKYGMYDLMNGVFYGNTESSGDDFTPGPEVINQNSLIPGMTWTATWNANSTTGVRAGTVNGVARCTSVTGTYDYGSSNNLATGFNDLTSAQQIAWNTPFTASTLSNYTRCWCKVTSINIDNDTVAAGTATWRYYGIPRDTECSAECAARCEYQGLQRTANFGKALFEQ